MAFKKWRSFALLIIFKNIFGANSDFSSPLDKAIFDGDEQTVGSIMSHRKLNGKNRGNFVQKAVTAMDKRPKNLDIIVYLLLEETTPENVLKYDAHYKGLLLRSIKLNLDKSIIYLLCSYGVKPHLSQCHTPSSMDNAELTMNSYYKLWTATKKLGLENKLLHPKRTLLKNITKAPFIEEHPSQAKSSSDESDQDEKSFLEENDFVEINWSTCL